MSSNNELQKKMGELQAINNALDCPSTYTRNEYMKLLKKRQSIMNWLDGGGWRKS